MKLNMKLNEILLVDEFRPRKVSDIILPQRYIKMFQDFVDQKGCPNLLLSGDRGIGKTSLIHAMVDELDATFLKINASLEGIDIIRTKVRDFAGGANGTEILFGEAPTGQKRIVLFDEFDGMSKPAQEALRGFIEEFQSNCIFIFTCNYKAKVIEAMYSRCKCIDFIIKKDEYGPIMKQFYSATCRILDVVGITYEKSIVAAIIKQKFPDFRSVLNEIQGYSMSGTLDSSILGDIESGNIGELYKLLAAGKWDDMRTWIAANSNIDEATVISQLASVKTLDTYVVKSSQPDAIEIIEMYLDKITRSRDPQITLAALCTVLMKSLKYV